MGAQKASSGTSNGLRTSDAGRFSANATAIEEFRLRYKIIM